MSLDDPADSEARRLEVLAALDLLDTSPEPIFDCATRTLARLLDVPIALVSLVDRDRQWFKSAVGLETRQTDRSSAFCAHTILGADVMTIEDAQLDPRFVDNPLVTGDPHIRFYVGMPIEARDGERIGSLCGIDTRPRRLGEADKQALRDLAALLSREVQHRQLAALARTHADSTRVALREGEALFRSVFELAAVGVAIVAPEGGFLRVNPALCEIVGYSADELLKLTFQHITHPDDLESDLTQLERVMLGEIKHYRLEKRYIRKSGEIVWINLTVAQQRMGEGGTQYFIAVVEDITERRQSAAKIEALTVNLERQVADRTRRLEHLVESTQRRNQQLRLLSEATALLTAADSYAEVAAIVRQFLPQVYPAVAGALFLGDANDFRRMSVWGASPQVVEQLAWADCWALRRGEEHRVADSNVDLNCVHCKLATPMPHACIPVFAVGQAVGLLELHWPERDAEDVPDSVLLTALAKQLGLSITNLKLREELRQQALHDPLTGLHNRRHLARFMEQCLADHRREGLGFAVLMLDLDHFKRLNDRFGHEFGDQVLIEVAALLRRVAHASDAAFRHGGEEFLMVLRGRTAASVRSTAERIRTSVADLELKQRGPSSDAPKLSISIGLAMFPDHGNELAGLFAAADQALYAAKAEGRNRVIEAPPLCRHSAVD